MTLFPPKEFAISFTREQIAARVGELASEMLPWIRDAESRTGQPILAICILRGAAFFFTDLLRAIPVSIDPAFCRTWGYTPESTLLDEIRVSSFEIEVRGRAVLLVDDICDSGATLQKLHEMYLAQGATAVKSVVVICRKVADPRHDPSWVAFQYPGSEWFVGYGMDMGDKWRNLPEIYRILK